MSPAIWKYPLLITDEQMFSAPRGARPLHVGVQNDTLFVWALVDTEQPHATQVVHIYGTGHPMEWDQNQETHIGSVQMGIFVWHCFWVTQL